MRWLVLRWITTKDKATHACVQCLKCEWTVVDGVNVLLFKAERRPAMAAAIYLASSSGRPCTTFFNTFNNSTT